MKSYFRKDSAPIVLVTTYSRFPNKECGSWINIAMGDNFPKKIHNIQRSLHCVYNQDIVRPEYIYIYTIMYKIDGLKSQNAFFIYHKRYCLFLESLFLCKQEDVLSRSCINKEILLWHFKCKWPLNNEKKSKETP